MMMRYGGTTRVANTAMLMAMGLCGGAEVGAPNKWGFWVRGHAVYGGGVRNGSILVVPEEEEKRVDSSSSHNVASAGGNKEENGIVSYWVIQPSRITKQDGTEWKWNCFRPWETYNARYTSTFTLNLDTGTQGYPEELEEQ
ncbi:ubiquinol oxidase 1, mitochondrial [Sesbania bispinosa]|nr:ubiquinol oxidase 1, mitochondrial [Sesbania bispinosa]